MWLADLFFQEQLVETLQSETLERSVLRQLRGAQGQMPRVEWPAVQQDGGNFSRTVASLLTHGHSPLPIYRLANRVQARDTQKAKPVAVTSPTDLQSETSPDKDPSAVQGKVPSCLDCRAYVLT